MKVIIITKPRIPIRYVSFLTYAVKYKIENFYRLFEYILFLGNKKANYSQTLMTSNTINKLFKLKSNSE